MSNLADERKRAIPRQTPTPPTPPPPRTQTPAVFTAGRQRFNDALTARIAAAKSRLLAGGVLQTVEWGIPTGERDNRGRTAYEYSEIYAMIEDRPALDRGSSATDRADATILTILDPVAILDEDLFRWGDPPHTHRVKAIDGLLQDEETGVRFASEVEIVR